MKKKNKVYDGQIPFTPAGKMLGYPEYWGPGDIDWRDNTTFYAWMKIVDCERGRSSVKIVLEDQFTGSKYEMFFSDLMDLIKDNIIEHGIIPACNWTFAKRGANYGIIPA